MNRQIELRRLCHSRAGDKSDSLNLSLIVYNATDYEFIREYVTVERVKAHFGQAVRGTVDRYEVPNIGALNFVLHGALGENGRKSFLSSDFIGKSWSGVLLDMQVMLPDP